MKQVLFILLVLFCTLNAQVDSNSTSKSENNNYLILNTGEKLFGRVETNTPLFKDNYLLLNDSTKYLFSKVKSFKNEEGYFAKVYGENNFVKRVVKGKIDLYREVKTWSTMGSYNTISTPGGSFTTFTPGTSSSVSYEYFSKGKGNIVEVDYSSLREAMIDNMESVKLLDEYRTLSYLGWVGTIAGVGIAASSFIGVDKEHPPNFSLMVVGALVSNVSYWVISSMKSDKLDKSIEVYNGLRK